MPCYDPRDSGDYSSGYSDGKSDGHSKGYKEGFAAAKARYENPNVVKMEGEHKDDLDRLNNQVLDLHTRNIQLSEEKWVKNSCPNEYQENRTLLGLWNIRPAQQ